MDLDAESGEVLGYPSPSLRNAVLAALNADPVEGQRFACPAPTVTRYYTRIVAVHDPDVTTAEKLTEDLRTAVTPLINQEYALGEPVRQLELQRCLYDVQGAVSGEVYLGVNAGPTSTADLPAFAVNPQRRAFYCPSNRVNITVT